MLARNELADYIADNYGSCERGADCYWGRDGAGRFNGCLRVGWRGRDCENWRPVEARTWDELKSTQVNQ